MLSGRNSFVLLSVFCFNSFRRPNAGSLLAVCSWSLARSFLLTVILAKRHSSLEADKQRRSLEGASSLWRCVCARVFVQGPVWCWGRLVQSIVWMSPERNSGCNSRTLTRRCQNRVFRESRLPSSLSVIVSSLLSSLSLFLFPLFRSLSASFRLCFGFNLKAALSAWCGLME